MQGRVGSTHWSHWVYTSLATRTTQASVSLPASWNQPRNHSRVQGKEGMTASKKGLCGSCCLLHRSPPVCIALKYVRIAQPCLIYGHNNFDKPFQLQAHSFVVAQVAGPLIR